MTDDRTRWTAAVAQIASVPDDATASAVRAADAIRTAEGQGARLIVFPEAFLGGYPKGASFGACLLYTSDAADE